MRQWCNNPYLHDTSNNNEIATAWAEARWILSSGNTYYIMGANGYYDTTPLSATQLIPHIRRTDMSRVFDIDKATEAGMEERVLREVLSTHQTVISEVEIVANQLPGGVVSRIDTPRATLQLPGFKRRSDLPAQYSPDVDLWLQELFGDHYPLACKWIGWALDFSAGPIAALSIKAEQGVGKKLFVQGLAECLEVPATADAADLTSNYQYGLMQSPFLVVNEGFPRLSKDSSPYHVFRGLVSGDPVRVNRRYMHPVVVRCAYRVIFTANNDNIIESMLGQANLSPEDRASLAIRLIHMDLGDRASKFLRARGGVLYTGQPGRRWIAGDGGEPSDYIIAKHFLWLYEKRVGPKGARFLVEGSAEGETDLMMKLRTQAGASPLVIETIVKMINANQVPQEIHYVDGKLFVLSQGIVEYFRKNLSHVVRDDLTSRKVSSALKGLAVREESSEGFVLKGRESMNRVRWIELDVRVLRAASHRIGHVCKRLDDMVAEQERLAQMTLTKQAFDATGHAETAFPASAGKQVAKDLSKPYTPPKQKIEIPVVKVEAPAPQQPKNTNVLPTGTTAAFQIPNFDLRSLKPKE